MRIAILADDFTGAAELAGVAMRCGLSAEVQESYDLASAADVIVLNTDSRSLPPPQAAALVAEVARPLRQAAPWVYKKVDSVLRGPIVAEIEAALDALALERAMLCPANPSLGRTVRGGHYYIGNVLLHQTSFAADGEYPAATSDVLALLGQGAMPISLLQPGGDLPPRGILVGQAESAADLAALARRVDEHTLPVGGAEFFAAVLEAKGHARAKAAPVMPPGRGPRLWVCGSAAAYAARTIAQARAHGLPILPMPQEVLTGAAAAPKAMRTWADQAAEALGQSGAAVVSIGTGSERPGSAEALTVHLAELAAAVLDRCGVKQVYVEGGATAAALARRMGWGRFAALGELAPGVVALQVLGAGGPVLTMKPGSYAWPEELWA
ncbi:MAG: four-carbon acid sugar kinase family protein [Phycisphaerae bacterium]|nr:four-carbon acid sugar kinase family protein [Phycisphaerae bacterium]